MNGTIPIVIKFCIRKVGECGGDEVFRDRFSYIMIVYCYVLMAVLAVALCLIPCSKAIKQFI
uniref:Putative hydrophobic membrane protein n=1 Tax=Potato yellow vein virus TaxID=103881 RepID=A0A3B8DZR7_9CLOS|nr:p7 [Potato yellow vein virus]QCI62250.1 putative hydrophobic membrane protein [Potato yellow vein virus]